MSAENDLEQAIAYLEEFEGATLTDNEIEMLVRKYSGPDKDRRAQELYANKSKFLIARLKLKIAKSEQSE